MLKNQVDLTPFAILTVIAFCCITALSRAKELHPLVVVGIPENDVALAYPVPEYPRTALNLHISGDVLVTVRVENGNVTNATANSHSSILAESARRWVEHQWKFRPSVSGTLTIPISYRESA
jgi:outer membrane biosynthesis protein TonB